MAGIRTSRSSSEVSSMQADKGRSLILLHHYFRNAQFKQMEIKQINIDVPDVFRHARTQMTL